MYSERIPRGLAAGSLQSIVENVYHLNYQLIPIDLLHNKKRIVKSF